MLRSGRRPRLPVFRYNRNRTGPAGSVRRLHRLRISEPVPRRGQAPVPLGNNIKQTTGPTWGRFSYALAAILAGALLVYAAAIRARSGAAQGPPRLPDHPPRTPEKHGYRVFRVLRGLQTVFASGNINTHPRQKNARTGRFWPFPHNSQSYRPSAAVRRDPGTPGQPPRRRRHPVPVYITTSGQELRHFRPGPGVSARKPPAFRVTAPHSRHSR